VVLQPAGESRPWLDLPIGSFEVFLERGGAGQPVRAGGPARVIQLIRDRTDGFRSRAVTMLKMLTMYQEPDKTPEIVEPWIARPEGRNWQIEVRDTVGRRFLDVVIALTS
jgi:hypothetical protein